MAERDAADAVDDGGERVAFGIWTVASAVLAAPASSDQERSLAEAVLLANPDPDAPQEMGSIADVWNRQMDCVINAANASHGERYRAKRRALMSQAVETGGYVLVDRETIAALIEENQRLKRPALPDPTVPADVARLVVAARAVAFDGHFDNVRFHDADAAAALSELDQASEAFASRVPWDDEPEEEADAAASPAPAAPRPPCAAESESAGGRAFTDDAQYYFPDRQAEQPHDPRVND